MNKSNPQKTRRFLNLICSVICLFNPGNVGNPMSSFLASSVDSDQTAPKEQFDLDLHCLHRFSFQIFTINTAIDCFCCSLDRQRILANWQN